MRYLWFGVTDQTGNNTASVRACVCQGDRVLGITLPLTKYSQENTVGTGTRYNALARYIMISKKYPLSPLKPRGLVLLSWHVPYNWGSGNSVHQSFTWFLSLYWCKSTFYRSRVPILFQNCLLWRHRHMGQPLAIVTSQWPIVPTGIYGRMMLRSAHFLV